MKKVTFILLFFLMMVNVSFGYTLTVNDFSVSLDVGRQISATAATKEGSSFQNWQVVSGNLTLTDPTNPKISFKMPASDVIINSVYNNSFILNVMPGGNQYAGEAFSTKEVTAPIQKEYTITYNYNGSGASNTTEDVNKKFSGWSLTGGGSISDSTSESTIYTYGTEDGTLTAQYTSGSTVLPKPTRTGYLFKSWNTLADGTGTSYAAGSTYSGGSNVTLYAQWTEITVSFNSVAAIKISRNINSPVFSGKEGGKIYIRKGDTLKLGVTTNSDTIKWTASSSKVTITNATSATASLTGASAGTVTVTVDVGYGKTISKSIFVYNAVMRHGQYSCYASATTSTVSAVVNHRMYMALESASNGRLKCIESSHYYVNEGYDYVNPNGKYFKSYYSKGATNSYDQVINSSADYWVYSSTL